MAQRSNLNPTAFRRISPYLKNFQEIPRAHLPWRVLKRQTSQKPYSPDPKIKKSQNKQRVLRTICSRNAKVAKRAHIVYSRALKGHEKTIACFMRPRDVRQSFLQRRTSNFGVWKSSHRPAIFLHQAKRRIRGWSPSVSGTTCCATPPRDSGHQSRARARTV